MTHKSLKKKQNKDCLSPKIVGSKIQNNNNNSSCVDSLTASSSSTENGLRHHRLSFIGKQSFMSDVINIFFNYYYLNSINMPQKTVAFCLFFF